MFFFSSDTVKCIDIPRSPLRINAEGRAKVSGARK
jgi:hypothetical protein